MGDIVPAVIAAVVAIVTCLAAQLFQVLASRRKDWLDSQKHLKNFRSPLIASAWELSFRLQNIVEGRFFNCYRPDHVIGEHPEEPLFRAERRRTEAHYCIESTTFIFCQFLACQERVRLADPLLILSSKDSAQKLATAQRNILKILNASDNRYGDDHVFCFYTHEQRAIGEAVLLDSKLAGDDAIWRIMGYSEYLTKYAPAVQTANLGGKLNPNQAGSEVVAVAAPAAGYTSNDTVASMRAAVTEYAERYARNEHAPQRLAALNAAVGELIQLLDPDFPEKVRLRMQGAPSGHQTPPQKPLLHLNLHFKGDRTKENAKVVV